MEQPPYWRVDTTEEFNADLEAVRPSAPRVDQVVDSWRWYLERRPRQYSEGLTDARDQDRIATYPDDVGDGMEYIAGATLDERQHIVLMRWLSIRSLLDD